MTLPEAVSVANPLRRRQFRPAQVGLFVTAAVLALITAFPLLWMISSSFKGRDEVTTSTLLPHSPTLDNFVYVFTKVPFPRYLFNSFVVAAVVTVVSLLFHSMAAYALARLRFPGRDKIFFGVFATMLITLPSIIVPLFLIARALGLLDSYAGLIIPMLFNAFGIFLLRQFYITLPGELEEAAKIDGAGYWRTYWSVILPLSRPIMSALAVFFFLANWNGFIWPLVIVSRQELSVVQIGIANFQQEYSANWSYVITASAIAAVPTAVLFLFFQRQIVESIKTSGLK
ncbi:MAG: carbohydrate ABC transporter permease [Kutzneria sp.]|nr:carbohydrate ABC transporter permease [Kutzneria sp.]